MQKRCLLLTLPAVLVLAGSTVSIPAQDEGPKNLQFFPKDTARADLMPHMRNFSFALGVPCTFCHGTEEQTTSNLEGVDFSLDIKPTKTKARAMLRMVDEINSTLLARVPHRSELNVEVTCFTCHSGMTIPDTVEGRVVRKIESDGIEAAVEDYRELRQRYYGTAAYNFAEQPLVEVAAGLIGQEKYPAAGAIASLNLEFHPESIQSKLWLAEAYYGQGELEQARPLFEAVAEAWSWHRGARQRLEAIQNPPQP